MWMIIGAVIVVFLLVLIIRTMSFVPEEHSYERAPSRTLKEEKIAEHLSEMIQCRTVSANADAKQYKAECERFLNLLKDTYPNLHASCELKRVGKTGLLYHWKGENHNGPVVFMAHYDVVPAEEEQWSVAPFSGLIQDGLIWGRGTLDTKCTLCAILEAAEYEISRGFQPKTDIWLAFSGEEEIFGNTCPDMVKEFEKNNMKPAFVLDEGGAIIRGAFPGVKTPCAMIGIAEKGFANVELRIKSAGGHAATPPVKSSIGRLGKAVLRIEKHPFSAQNVVPVRAMFDTLGRYSSFGLRILFANYGFFRPLLAQVMKKNGGEMNSMMRTTCAITRMKASDAFNVIPTSAKVGMNLRLLGSDTAESAVQYLKKTVKDKAVEVHLLDYSNPSVISSTDCTEWKKLCQVIHQTWPDTLVSPYLMMACSDSRHYGRISDHVYRFSAMELSREERTMIHGIDERIPIEKMVRATEFYCNLIENW